MKKLALVLTVLALPVLAQTPEASPSAVPVTGTIEWFHANWAVIFAVLFGISETLALIPVVKANSLFQLFYNILVKFKPEQ